MYRHSFHPLSTAGKDLQTDLKLEAKSNLTHLGSAKKLNLTNLSLTTNHPRHLNPLIVEDEDVSFGVEAQTHWLLQLTIAWGGL